MWDPSPEGDVPKANFTPGHHMSGFFYFPSLDCSEDGSRAASWCSVPWFK